MNTLLDFDVLVKAVSGRAVSCCTDDKRIFSSVVTDSRNVVQKSLFVPLIGEFQDGHKYIPQAVEKGASIVFIAASEYEQHRNVYDKTAAEKNVSFVIVENTLTALQNAAEAYVHKFPGLIRAAVTGSSGKTTTKEITVSILKEKYRVVSTVGNLNSETGLPLSVFKITENDEVGFFEMGMNRKNEIGEIAKVLKPEYAIITNIGTAHIGILGSRENIASEKKKIFTYIDKDGTAFIPAADDFADFLAEDVKGAVVRYGIDVPDSGVVFKADKGIEGTEFTVDDIPVTLHLPGKYNYQNALAGIALARRLGVSAGQIKAGIEKIVPMEGRSQIVHIKLHNQKKDDRSVTLFQDCYNANPDSVSKTLELCSSVKQKKIYVLGDMLELGKDSKAAHTRVGCLAAESVKTSDGILVFVGPEMKAAAEAAKKTFQGQIEHFESYGDDTITQIVKMIKDSAADEDFILLKGSHGIGLERISAELQRG